MRMVALKMQDSGDLLSATQAPMRGIAGLLGEKLWWRYVINTAKCLSQ